jgi:hypothetical protein
VKKERVIKTMREIAEREVATVIDLWPRLERRLTSGQHTPKLAGLQLAPRLSWAAAILALLLVVGTVAYATSPALRALLTLDPGLQDVEVDARLLDLSQTVNGVTVNLDWAYADANRIAVAYSIDAPGRAAEEQRYHATDLVLRHESGAVLPPMFGMGLQGQSDLLGIELPPGQSAMVMSFDTTSLPRNSEILALQMDLTVETFDPMAELEQLPAEVVAEDATSESVLLDPLAGERTRIGPFSFHFTVPLDPAHRVLDQPMTTTMHGIGVTLESLVVTPSEMTAVTCLEPPDNGTVEWLPISEVAVQEAESGPSAPAHVSVQTPLERRNCTVNRHLPSLYEADGSWTLTVTELVGWTMDGRSQTRVEGPWVFELNLVP